MILRAVLLSSTEVGSSNIQRDGFFIKSYPIDVLFFSPPDNPFTKLPPTDVSIQSYSPKIWAYSKTFNFLSS